MFIMILATKNSSYHICTTKLSASCKSPESLCFKLLTAHQWKYIIKLIYIIIYMYNYVIFTKTIFKVIHYEYLQHSSASPGGGIGQLGRRSWQIADKHTWTQESKYMKYIMSIFAISFVNLNAKKKRIWLIKFRIIIIIIYNLVIFADIQAGNPLGKPPV